MKIKPVVVTLEEDEVQEILEISLGGNKEDALKILKKLSKRIEKQLKER